MRTMFAVRDQHGGSRVSILSSMDPDLNTHTLAHVSENSESMVYLHFGQTKRLLIWMEFDV